MGKIFGFFAGKQTLSIIAIAVVLGIFSMGVIKVYDLFKVNGLKKDLAKANSTIITLVETKESNEAQISSLIAKNDTCNALYSNMESQYQTQIKTLTNRAVFAEKKYNQVKDGGCQVVKLKGWPNRGEVESDEWVIPCPY